MEIYIEIEAAGKYKKGDRVVVNCGTKKEPEYYIGTVKSAGAKVTVDFDDGDKDAYPAKSPKLMGKGLKKKKKSEISKSQLKKWLSGEPGGKKTSKAAEDFKKAYKKAKKSHKYDLPDKGDGSKPPTNAQMAYAMTRVTAIFKKYSDKKGRFQAADNRTDKMKDASKLNAWQFVLRCENWQAPAERAKKKLEQMGYKAY